MTCKQHYRVLGPRIGTQALIRFHRLKGDERTFEPGAALCCKWFILGCFRQTLSANEPTDQNRCKIPLAAAILLQIQHIFHSVFCRGIEFVKKRLIPSGPKVTVNLKYKPHTACRTVSRGCSLGLSGLVSNRTVNIAIESWNEPVR